MPTFCWRLLKEGRDPCTLPNRLMKSAKHAALVAFEAWRALQYSKEHPCSCVSCSPAKHCERSISAHARPLFHSRIPPVKAPGSCGRYLHCSRNFWSRLPQEPCGSLIISRKASIFQWTLATSCLIILSLLLAPSTASLAEIHKDKNPHCYFERRFQPPAGSTHFLIVFIYPTSSICADVTARGDSCCNGP